MLVGVGVLAALVEGAGVGVDRVPDLQAPLVDEAEVVEELRVVWLDLDRLLHQILRLPQVLAAGERATEEIERFGEAVVHRHGLPELRLGLLQIASLDQDAAETRAIERLLGVQLHGLAERLQRPVRLSHAAEQRAVLVLQRRVGFELVERHLHLLAGRGEIALRRQSLAHARMRDRVVGILLQRTRKRVARLVRVAHRQGKITDGFILHRRQRIGGHLESHVEPFLRAGLVVA